MNALPNPVHHTKVCGRIIRHYIFQHWLEQLQEFCEWMKVTYWEVFLKQWTADKRVAWRSLCYNDACVSRFYHYHFWFHHIACQNYYGD